jgi:arylsulfatase A-like enzyme
MAVVRWIGVRSTWAHAVVLIGLGLVTGAAAQLASADTASGQGDAPDQRPNVVVILADDLGYADVSANVDPAVRRFPTPNIDRLGAEGVRFTAGYVAAPVCGPSRAALMTGRYPQRYGFEFNNGPPGRDAAENLGLAPGELTIADLLGEAGYRTALVGKWHLGSNEAFYPTNRGFDEFFGFLPGGTAYIDPGLPGVHSVLMEERAAGGSGTRGKALELLRGANREVVDNMDRYLTDELTAEAEAFIGRNKDRPFFLYLAFNAPHTPLQVTQKYYDRFPQIDNEAQRIYAAMVSALDDGVGRVLAALDANGIAENTLVVFLSDNGCAAYIPGLCACDPLRGGKLSHFEGGVRVPFMLRWPDRVPAGTVHHLPVSALDILPTAVAAAGGRLPADRPFDGSDLVLQLQGSGLASRELFWWRAPMRSVRVGDWKLWTSEQGDVGYLFDLSRDPGERNNLFDTRPDKVKELSELMVRWHGDKAPPAWASRPHATYEACGATITVPI